MFGEERLTKSEDEKELGQISVYIAKPGVPFEDALDWDKASSKAKFEAHDLDVDGVACKFLYFETFAPKKNPPWLEFANVQLPKSDQIEFSSTSHSANGVLGLEIDGRIFIAAFGRSASALVDRKSVESDFGIRTAMNLCGNEEIRQTRTQSHSLTPTHIDRQVGRPSGAFVFGLSEAEDLKFISAHLKGDPLVTLQGRDHLTIKVLGRHKLTWDRLIDRCRGFIEAYDKDDYVSLFPNYRNFKAADQADIEKLDQLLIDALSNGEMDDIQLWIPEFISDDEFSFSYTDYNVRENTIYAYLDTEQLSKELDLEKIEVKKLKNKRVFAYSHDDNRVLSNKWWSVYDCIVYEQKIDTTHFILTDGEWKKVDDDFYRTITDFISNDVKEEPCETLYANISIADHTQRKNREGVFNVEACKRRPQSIKFDQANLRIGASRKDKEFCDILDLTDDGVMRIINCKPYKGSSGISYLFGQTRFYCESFVRDQTFLDAIRDYIKKSSSPTKAAYLAHIRSEVKEVEGSDYRVCVWLLCDKRKKLPTKSDLPFMGQFELKHMYDQLQQVSKYQDIVLRFVPVETVNFVKGAKPDKAKR